MGDKANGPDSEKGNNSLARLSISEGRPLGSTKIINVSETPAPVTNVPKLGGGASSGENYWLAPITMTCIKCLKQQRQKNRKLSEKK